jgi:hypothetical protein
MCGVSELTIVGFKLEELSGAFHAQGLSRFRLILRGSLHKINVFLLLLLNKLSHMLSQHRLVCLSEFSCV